MARIGYPRASTIDQDRAERTRAEQALRRRRARARPPGTRAERDVRGGLVRVRRAEVGRAHYGVAFHAVRQALEALRGRGLIVTAHGRGTYVR